MSSVSPSLAIIKTSEVVLRAQLKFLRLLSLDKDRSTRVYLAEKIVDGLVTIALTKPNQKCAVKVILKAALANTSNDVLRQVTTWSRLDSLNISKLYAAYETENAWYLLTEYLNGGDLLTRLNNFKGSLDYGESTAHMLFRQIARAVNASHESGVIIRDLRLDSVMLSSTAEWAVLKMTDFGSSCLASDLSSLSVSCGTVGFKSPEMIRLSRGQHPTIITTATDIWSLGVIAFFLLSGTLPFDTSSEDAYNASALAGRLDFHSAAWQAISGDAKDLVTCMLLVDPTKRITAELALKHPWSTSREISRRLLALAQRNFGRLKMRRHWHSVVISVLFVVSLWRKARKSIPNQTTNETQEEVPGTSQKHKDKEAKHHGKHSASTTTTTATTSTSHRHKSVQSEDGVLSVQSVSPTSPNIPELPKRPSEAVFTLATKAEIKAQQKEHHHHHSHHKSSHHLQSDTGVSSPMLGTRSEIQLRPPKVTSPPHPIITAATAAGGSQNTSQKSSSGSKYKHRHSTSAQIRGRSQTSESPIPHKNIINNQI